MEGRRITCICATCGRHTLMERSLRFFMNQRFDTDIDAKLLIFNNSKVRLELDDLSRMDENHLNANQFIHLVNQHIDSETNEPYKTLGGIYNDALKHVDTNTDIVVHWDDDDIFLPSHIQEGFNGIARAKTHGKIAYKPAQSYYRHPDGQELMVNVLEPSIFVPYQHLLNFGYSLETTAQHHQWLNPLLESNSLFVDPEGKPTLVYNWGDIDIPTFKTSGDPNNKYNFRNYRSFSQDHGDKLLTPWPKAKVQEYYLV